MPGAVKKAVDKVKRKIKFFHCARVLRMEKEWGIEKTNEILSNPDSPLYKAFAAKELELINDPDTGLEYFIENYCPGFSPSGGSLIPFKLWNFQRRIVEAMKGNFIALKVRRAGITTLASFAVYREARFVEDAENSNIIYIPNKGKTGRRFIARIREIDKYVQARAPWLNTQFNQLGKNAPIEGDDNKNVIECAGRSVIIEACIPGNDPAGLSARILIFDEFGVYSDKADPDKTYATAEPLTRGGGLIWIFSTSKGKRGKGAKFYSLWQGAKARKNRFKAIFISRREHPWYNYEGFVEELLEGGELTMTEIGQEYPLVEEDAWAEDPEGAIFVPEELYSVLEVGDLIAKKIEPGGLGNLGIDWGYTGSGVVISRPQLNFGTYIHKAWTLRKLSSEEATTRIMKDAGKVCDYFGYAFYDPGGTGTVYNETFRDRYKRDIRVAKVSFNKNKKRNLVFLQNLVSRTHKQWTKEKELAKAEGREPSTENLLGYLAINRNECPELVQQMFEAKVGDSGGVEKKKSNDEQHELDGLICAVQEDRVTYKKAIS